MVLVAKKEQRVCLQDRPVAVDGEAIDALDVTSKLLVGSFKD